MRHRLIILVVTRSTRGVYVVFPEHESDPVTVLVWINLTLLLKKSCIVHMTVFWHCCTLQCWQLDTIIDRMYLVDQSKPCAQIYLQKIPSCINIKLPIIIFKKLIIWDLCHRKTYMYINFQQNRVCRSVKIVHTNLVANCINLQLAIRIFKNHAFRTRTTP